MQNKIDELNILYVGWHFVKFDSSFGYFFTKSEDENNSHTYSWLM